ncbi:MAG: glycosyltransferase family 4 protein [Lacunisphaera sp.]
MKVVILSEYFHPDNSGGTPTELSDLAAALKARHTELVLDVITSSNLYRSPMPKGGLPRRESWAGMTITRLRVPKSNRPSMALRLFFGGIFALATLVELMRRPRYDLIFVVTNPPGLAGATWFYHQLTRVPYLYLVHDLYPDIAIAMGRVQADGWFARSFARSQRGWLRSSSKVVVLGRCMKEYLIQHYGLVEQHVRVISSWSAISSEDPAAGENEFRRQLDHSGTVVLYAGNLSEYVRIDRFLAAARLLSSRPDILFVFIGDGAMKQSLAHEIASQRFENVRLLPRVPRDRMGSVLAGCDIALVSLDQRMLGLGVPSKLYGILAAGRAVLAVMPEQSEVARVLQEEDCGVNVSAGTPERIAAEIVRLADSRVRLEELGRNAQAAVRAKYSIDDACGKYWSEFKQLVEASASAPNIK